MMMNWTNLATGWVDLLNQHNDILHHTDISFGFGLKFVAIALAESNFGGFSYTLNLVILAFISQFSTR